MSRYLACTMEGVEIDLCFKKHVSNPGTDNKETSRYIALLLRGENGAAFTFDGTVAARIDPLFEDMVPEGFSVDLNSALFVHVKYDNPEKSKLLLGVDFGVDIKLSGLPMVGKIFPKDQRAGIERFQVLFTKTPWNSQEVGILKTTIPPGTYRLPAVLPTGSCFFASILLGGQTLDVCLSTVPAPHLPPPSQAGAQPAAVRPAAAGKTQWAPVNKAFGPVMFKRVGARYRDKKIYFLIDAQMAMGPLTVSLAGLSIGTPITSFKPEFKFDGMGISLARGPVRVTGAFLYDRADQSYNGTAVIATPSLTLSALGAYKKINGRPSIFAYVALNLVSGVGPIFFQVKGLSAGFGFNRTVKVPHVVDVKEFPLVRMANEPHRYSGDPLTVLQSVKHHFPAAPGEFFLAFGVKFTSFKLINGFVLLILSFGQSDKLRLNVLGTGKLTVPVPKPGAGGGNVTPLAQVEIGIKGTFDFYDGSLQVVEVLTPESFILSRDCRLTGGYAFSSWARGEHAGDFVYTMGGYHPDYIIPVHYPRVPRLGFHWQLTSMISIKGEMYYALTPGAAMAGGRLEALFQFECSVGFDIGFCGAVLYGKIRAYFVMGADFIISWQPYYYDARVYLGIGIDVTFRGTAFFRIKLPFKTIKISKSVEKRFGINLGANLEIWGPEFAGIAHVDWHVISFDIQFGKQESKEPVPLGWNDFKQAFLPPGHEISTVSVEDGIIRKLGTTGEYWVVNPAELVLSTHSAIPSTESNARGGGKGFGIGSMKVAKGEVISRHNIVISGPSGNSGFDLEPVYKSGPEALWGENFLTGIDDLNRGSGKMITGMLTGYRIKPRPKIAPNVTEDKPVEDFNYDIELKDGAYRWTAAMDMAPGPAEDDARRVIIRDIAGREAERNAILEALGLDGAGVDLRELGRGTEDAFLTAPRVVQAT